MLKKKTYSSLIYYALLIGAFMFQLFSYESFSERSYKPDNYPLNKLKVQEVEENSALVTSYNKHFWLESHSNILSITERNYWIAQPIQLVTFTVSTIPNPPAQFFYLNRNSLSAESSDESNIKA